MASDLKIITNQINSRKSTGPKSNKGKQNSRFNALKSGTHARTRVLPGEDKKECETLAARIWEEIKPQGFLEEALTDQITCDFIILKRVERSLNAYYVQRAHIIAQERVVLAEQMEAEETLDIFTSSEKKMLYDARRTKPTREDLEVALAESVGKEMGDVYERIDKRRRGLIRDILQKYRELDYLRERRLLVIEANAIEQSA